MGHFLATTIGRKLDAEVMLCREANVVKFAVKVLRLPTSDTTGLPSTRRPSRVVLSTLY
jgi:hypothetical protein